MGIAVFATIDRIDADVLRLSLVALPAVLSGRR